MYISIQKQKTQQFAKFFIKDLKTKNSNFLNKNFDLDEYNSSSSN